MTALSSFDLPLWNSSFVALFAIRAHCAFRAGGEESRFLDFARNDRVLLNDGVY
jgi:hypothetical protein